ncbi:Alpha/Beta hydrolase protein [Thamnocephalis sphaerospora]|uniref:Alpha/Beta hydrolase protein n=1 Tax=Thamnocephalis sphaerospora TaxID=78915 RepID=A0A4P9XLJ3_9FUNG|nr:Alpha/Beta hydrolase protein [Thamnocephalis sphaerospora]|eukprot:RKP06733.1 Alpha/Beta hydrolase protein [Thamnocephalis sphaerospora]
MRAPFTLCSATVLAVALLLAELPAATADFRRDSAVSLPVVDADAAGRWVPGTPEQKETPKFWGGKFIDRMKQKFGHAACRAHRTSATIKYFIDRLANGGMPTGTPAEVRRDYLRLVPNEEEAAKVLLPHPHVNTSLPKRELAEILATKTLIHRYLFYSAISYCDNRTIAAEQSTVVLQQDDYPVPTPVNGFKILYWHEQDWLRYYIAASPYQKTIVLVFRGSMNNDNFKKSIDTKPIIPNAGLYASGWDTAQLPKEARLLRGYAGMAEKQMEKAGADLLRAHRDFPDYAVVIAGHSMGGAVAHLAATHIRTYYGTRLPISTVYTYNEPIPGNAVFNDWSAEVLHDVPFFRVTSKDVVTSLFQADLPGMKEKHRYRHAADITEVHCPDAQKNEMIICDGGLDPKCVAGYSCNDLTWEFHSDFAGQRGSRRVCLLSQA